MSIPEPLPVLRILLVEDYVAFAQVIEVLLEQTGIECDVAHCITVEEAQVRLAGDRYDVVFLDLKLPNSRGLDTVRKVMAAPSVPPVVVLTGDANEQERMAALALGVQEYAPKDRLVTGGAAYLREVILRAVYRDRGFSGQFLGLARLLGREG